MQVLEMFFPLLKYFFLSSLSFVLEILFLLLTSFIVFQTNCDCLPSTEFLILLV